jgi:hypothetical protein
MMKLRTIGAGTARRAIAVLAALAICTAVSPALAGCAGELPVPGQTSSTSPSAFTTISTEPQTVQLGKQVAALWSESIQKIIPLLEGTPPAASIQTQMADLKEQYVQRMVTLGRQIRALPASDQQSIYERTLDILSSEGATEWFLSYKDLYERYAALSDQASQDLAVTVSSFNTLTQYAFFDVLIANDPDEATRLGVQ